MSNQHRQRKIKHAGPKQKSAVCPKLSCPLQRHKTENQANIPRAKGRLELVIHFLPDRMVKEMPLQDFSTLA
jgi:hypothetical protein